VNLRCRLLLLGIAVFLLNSNTRAETVPVSGGTFVMGCSDGNLDERPPRTVSVAPFSIHSYEVTESQYSECVTLGKCTPAHYDDNFCRIWNGKRFERVRVPSSARNPDYPVVCVTWQQAQQYCRAQGMFLPTEAQWEFAARAGTTTRYPWGTAGPSARHCIVKRTHGPARVGTCQPNGWGLYDMIGNAWEWVKDYYNPQEYTSGEDRNPNGPETGFYRVIRGGGWYSQFNQAEVANRQWFSPGFAEASIGFRCVKR
jgi:formylglycine-generating enzyme